MTNDNSGAGAEGSSTAEGSRTGLPPLPHTLSLPRASVVWALTRAAPRVARVIEDALVPVGLSFTEVSALWAVKDTGADSATAVAAVIGQAVAPTASLLRALAGRELLTWGSEQVRALAVTPAGERLLAWGIHALAAVEAVVAGACADPDALITALAGIRAGIRRAAGPPPHAIHSAAPRGDADRAFAPPRITDEHFGYAGDLAVQRFTLTNDRGMRVAILTYGGIIQSLTIPDRRGQAANVVLGLPTLDDYLADHTSGNSAFLGALIGRYAGRIAGDSFTLDGVTHNPPVNDNGNSLHGGTTGFHQHVWTPTQIITGDGTVALRLEHVSPHGSQGYPGTLTTDATYILDNDNRLTLAFTATTDAPTVVNLTNHTYGTLAGESSGTVYDQLLQINARHYTPIGPGQIPTGSILPVEGTPLDFTSPTRIGAHHGEDHEQLRIGHGYDQNWVLDRPTDPTALCLAARARDPASGRTLTLYTTQPGLQFYSGNYLDGTLTGTGGRPYHRGAGFALETQHFPDSPNQPGFPPTVLRPGETYRHTTLYELSTQ